MKALRTGQGIYRLGQLPDGRNLYRAVTVDGSAYCASDEIITAWDEGTWWLTSASWVQTWIKTVERDQ